MHKFDNDLSFGRPALLGALRAMTSEQFRELGKTEVAYLRELDGQTLKGLLPNIQLLPGIDAYFLLLAADGEPLMVSDDRESVIDWLETRNATLAVRQ
ncbi:MAG: DUF1150 family protein [Hyphomicrobiaceae bacterium]|nr:DUF1150 family protein [Hyphomicrobiaceae bacterium]